MDAEQAYLFRHALLRDAAYELHLPETRARLHLLAAELLAMVFGDQAAGALEIAAHLRAAGSIIPDPAQQAREARYLDVGAAYAHQVYDHPACISALERLRDLSSEPQARAGVCMRLVTALDKVGRMNAAAELAMECSRLTSDPESRARALTRATWFYASAHQDAQSQAAYRELEALARAAPGARLNWHAAGSLALVKYFAGDIRGGGAWRCCACWIVARWPASRRACATVQARRRLRRIPRRPAPVGSTRRRPASIER